MPGSFSHNTYTDPSGRPFRGTGSADGRAILNIDTGERYELYDQTRSLFAQRSQPVAAPPPIVAPAPGNSPQFALLWIIALVAVLGPAYLICWAVARLLGYDRRAAGQFLFLLLVAGVILQWIGAAYLNWNGPAEAAIWYFEYIVGPIWAAIAAGYGKISSMIG